MTNFWKLDETGAKALEAAEQVVAETIGPNASAVDEAAAFPRAGMDALRQAGLFGLVNGKENGGMGQGLRAAAAVVECIARQCPSTAMVTKMHFCGSAVIDMYGTDQMKRQITEGGKLTTLAFSEFGSRSHFWQPVSTATKSKAGVALNATKQLITSSGECDIYVWSSQPAEADGLSSIWFVPADTPGVGVTVPWDGLGLRGNGSRPIRAENATIPEANRLGADGSGFDIMMALMDLFGC